ncbi:MAG TPA: hypothetical protein VGF99_14105 [Myxococcota bacterium]
MNTTSSATLALLLTAMIGACTPAAGDDDGGTRRPRPGDDDDVGCGDDSDCRGGEVCDDDVCVPACRVTDSCGEEGEGELPTEGEGEQPTEGEDEGEGEGEGEGEQPAEGEGEQPAEGEGEQPAEGEGEHGGADDVVIELSWPAAASNNDIDLHLSRTSPPTWCSQTETCWWQKESTSWGAALEQDSLTGDEPEIIRLTNASNGTYTVGIGVYSEEITALNATVRVLAGGVEIARRSRTVRFGVEWVPLSIRISGGSVTTTAIDTLRAESGTCWSTTTTPDPADPDDGRTGTGCTANSRCATGYTCFNGSCADSCSVDADCNLCSADTGGTCTCFALPGIGGSCLGF